MRHKYVGTYFFSLCDWPNVTAVFRDTSLKNRPEYKSGISILFKKLCGFFLKYLHFIKSLIDKILMSITYCNQQPHRTYLNVDTYDTRATNPLNPHQCIFHLHFQADSCQFLPSWFICGAIIKLNYQVKALCDLVIHWLLLFMRLLKCTSTHCLQIFLALWPKTEEENMLFWRKQQTDLGEKI